MKNGTMFAVIRTGGKQYKVSPDQVVAVEKLPGEAGDVISFADVLMVGGAEGWRGHARRAPTSRSLPPVLEQKRDDKVIVFKKKRRHNYRRLNGHRQYLTVVRIAEIAAAGVTHTSKKRATSKPAADDAPEASAAESA